MALFTKSSKDGVPRPQELKIHLVVSLDISGSMSSNLTNKKNS